MMRGNNNNSNSNMYGTLLVLTWLLCATVFPTVESGMIGWNWKHLVKGSHNSNTETATRQFSPNNDNVNNNNKATTELQEASSNDNTENPTKAGSWLDGLNFEKYDPKEDVNNVNHKEQQQGNGESALSFQQLHPLLQIPASLTIPNQKNKNKEELSIPVQTFCDTASSSTILSYSTAKRLGLLPYLDKRQSVVQVQATGVGGTCRIVGQLPAGFVNLSLYGSVTVPSPAMLVLDDPESDEDHQHVEVLLGLDFLRHYQAIVDLRDEELRIVVEDDEYAIPFIRPRGTLPGLEEMTDTEPLDMTGI